MDGIGPPALAPSARPFRTTEGALVESTLYICQTCRMGQPVPDDGIVPGARLLAAVAASGLPDGVRLVPASCLQACAKGCAIALTRNGAWSYVQGGLGPDDAAEVVTMARQFSQSPEGLVPWRERSALFRQNTVARIPPLPLPQPLPLPLSLPEPATAAAPAATALPPSPAKDLP